ncbi:MAG: MaoC family dehydratase N-terminal domain-containing protein [Ktedonobacterales bacterium]
MNTSPYMPLYPQQEVNLMPLDQSLVGFETPPVMGEIRADDVRAFSDAIGDLNPIYRDLAAAQAAGFANIPAPPTFVTRFHVQFADVGLDPARSQVLHGEQEYSYMRPLLVGETVTARYRVAALRQSARAGGMAILTLEQLCDTADGERVVTGKSVIIVRDQAPGEGAAGSAASAAKPASATPEGMAIPTLTKHVTQEQINAYADVSGDHNPIHLDPAAARAVGLDGTIAHGMLSMAFLGQTLTDWLASLATPGAFVERLRVRFQGMVRPGDTISCQGVLGANEQGLRHVDLWIANQRGERVTTSDADARLS